MGHPQVKLDQNISLELSEVINNTEECNDKVHENTEKLFNNYCKTCGIMICYADDATYTTMDKSRQVNQDKITNNLEKVKKFLNINNLAINKSKTTITEFMNKQKRGKARGRPPTLEVIDENNEVKEIETKKYCRLLGGNFSQDLTWNAHMVTGEKPLISEVRKKIGALRHIKSQLNLQSRKILAEGLILSKIKYLIPLWGGLPKSTMNKIQVLINMAGRFVLNVSKRTKSKTVLEKCGWLSAIEMTKYQTMVLVWNIVRQKRPRYWSEIFTLDEENKINIPRARLIATRQSFKWRASGQWNQLSEELRSCENLRRFKKRTQDMDT